jgi:hypothetical protein
VLKLSLIYIKYAEDKDREHTKTWVNANVAAEIFVVKGCSALAAPFRVPFRFGCLRDRRNDSDYERDR